MVFKKETAILGKKISRLGEIFCVCEQSRIVLSIITITDTGLVFCHGFEAERAAPLSDKDKSAGREGKLLTDGFNRGKAAQATSTGTWISPYLCLCILWAL